MRVSLRSVWEHKIYLGMADLDGHFHAHYITDNHLLEKVAQLCSCYMTRIDRWQLLLIFKSHLQVLTCKAESYC